MGLSTLGATFDTVERAFSSRRQGTSSNLRNEEPSAREPETALMVFGSAAGHVATSGDRSRHAPAFPGVDSTTRTDNGPSARGAPSETAALSDPAAWDAPSGLFGAVGDAATSQLLGHSCNPEDFRQPPAPQLDSRGWDEPAARDSHAERAFSSRLQGASS